MKMTTKLVYKDDKAIKVLWGHIIKEDEVFISFITNDGNNFRVNKQNIISIKEKGGGNDS